MDSPAPFEQRLFCPGPTKVPESSRLAGLKTDVYHRTSAFYQTFLSCRKKLQTVFESEHLPIILGSSGTGAMEAAVVNLTDPGDLTITINGGKFGHRWTALCETYQCDNRELSIPWGTAPDAETLDRFLADLGVAPKALFLQANETSTATRYPVAALTQIVRERYPDCLVVVDAVSGLLTEPLPMAELGVDVMVSGSQKGFGVPAGLSFVALSSRSMDRFSSRPRFYFDLRRELASQQEGRSAWTPPTTLIMALENSLNAILDRGLAFWHEKHRRHAQAARSGAAAMELQVLGGSHPSLALTAIQVDLPAEQIIRMAKDQYGVQFAGGQDQLKGKIVRISHLGFLDDTDLITGFGVFETCYHRLTGRGKVGTGMAALLNSLTQA